MHNTTKHTTPLGNYDVPTGWPMKPYKRPYGGTPGAPVMYEKPSDPEDEGAGYGYSNAEGLEENDIYFYHSDHLGSTSYITDKGGNATQFVCYKPYGEAIVDEHATSYEMPWKFNGKELDSETGLYYYGARYYEPVLAMWYGVDALAEKAPNMSPYMYCFANPIKLIDPNGNWPWENRNVKNARKYADNNGGTFQRWEGKNGMTYASVTSTSQDNIGFTVTAKVFKPTKQEQHNVLWNIMEAIDIPEGQADGALQGNITQQDIKVGFGIMGTIAGVMSLGSSELVLGPGTAIGVLGTANSLDDVFTNENGQSMAQQLFESNEEEIGLGKNVISIVSIGNDFFGIFKDGNLVNIIDAANGSLAVINEIKNQISDGNNEQNVGQ